MPYIEIMIALILKQFKRVWDRGFPGSVKQNLKTKKTTDQ